MTTVIFIHGISNMPEPNVLQRLWENALATDYPDNPGVEIGVYGSNVELCYWSDILYEDFAESQTGAESAEMSNAIRKESPSLEDVSEVWVEKISQELGFDIEDLMSAESLTPLDGKNGFTAGAEAIPLPWFLKKHLMRAFVRDAHHYLFDVTHSPRPGEIYQVRHEIRNRFVSKLTAAAKDGPIIVLSHSLGTVIAYDCLKNISTCPSIQDLITVGSPLGMSEMQDKLVPGYSVTDGYAYEKVKVNWNNIFDPLDIVSRADPILKNDYLQNGKKRVIDTRQNNGGVWTHDMLKYLAQPELRKVLRTGLKKL